jgi:hypothetical protein
LVPDALEGYLYSGIVNPNNKDTLINLSENLIINLDELENLNKTELGSLKALITQSAIRLRKAYGIYNEKTKLVTGSKIVEFSQICELNIVEKNTCVGKDNVMMAGFKDMQIEKYIKKIQESGFTVVVYVQDESAKNTTRSLGGIFSPGTYFQSETETYKSGCEREEVTKLSN